MRKIILIVISVLCVVLLLASCNKTLNAGTVIDKHFSPSHMVYNPIITIVNGKMRSIPRFVSHPDEWSIQVQNGEDKEWWEVSKKYYESVEIGEYVEREVK